MLGKTTLSGLPALNRRGLLKSAGAAAALLAVPQIAVRRASAGNPIEIIHWSWLAASDGEVWAKMIAAFNEAHKDKGIQIKMELVPEEQYVTKILAATASGIAEYRVSECWCGHFSSDVPRCQKTWSAVARG